MAPNPITRPGADLADEALRELEIRGRLLRQLFTLGRSTLGSAALAAAFSWGTFYLLTGRRAVLAWAVLIHASQLLRLYFLRANEAAFPIERFRIAQPGGAARFVLPLTISAVVWGLAGWFFLPLQGATVAQGAFLTVMVFGMLAGSIPAVASWPSAIVVWLAPLTVGIASRFMWQGGNEGWIFGIATVMFGATMAQFAFVQHRLLRSGLQAQLDKEVLSDRLMAQSHELERLGQERSRFFASASHDLRQPVHALALFSRALQRDLTGHPALPMADQVVKATDAVSGLLNAMLDISKIEAGAVQPVMAPLAIDEVFLRLAQIYESRAETAGLQLRFHLLPTVVVSDRDLVFRILSNFVDNAFKYSTRGGVLISARRRGGRVRLAVWDTGRGIEAVDLPRIFEEFFQVDNAHRDVSKGLGIGLAIVKRLAELLGGEVGVNSRPGRGSVFWLDLPARSDSSTSPFDVAQSAAVAPTTPAPLTALLPASVPAHGRRPNLLLLDDEHAVGEAMRAWLQPHCADIRIARSVETAVDWVATTPDRFDAFLVDFRLAGTLNGIEATALLRARAGRKVPTILVTGDTDPDRVRAAYRSGLIVLFKPVEPEQLLDTLRELLATEAG